MFIIKPSAGNGIDLDRFINTLRQYDVDFTVAADAQAVDFPLDPSEIRVSNGLAVIQVIDMDQLARIVRWFSLSQAFEFTVFNDEDQIEVVIVPESRAILDKDIVDHKIPLGEHITEFSIGLVGAISPPDPWGMEPTSPTEKTASWLKKVAEEHPEIRGKRHYRIATRNIYIWTKRRSNLFSGIGESSALFWRQENGTDVWGIFFKFANIITKKMMPDEASDGSDCFLFKGSLRICDHPELRNSPDLKRQRLIDFGREAVNEFESEIAIDLDDGAFSIRKNGGFWVRVFHWNGGEIREEDRFIAAN